MRFSSSASVIDDMAFAVISAWASSARNSRRFSCSNAIWSAYDTFILLCGSQSLLPPLWFSVFTSLLLVYFGVRRQSAKHEDSSTRVNRVGLRPEPKCIARLALPTLERPAVDSGAIRNAVLKSAADRNHTEAGA